MICKKPNQLRILPWMFISALPLMAACSGANGKENTTDVRRPDVRVMVKPVESLSGKSVFQYNGTVEPFRSVPLNFQVTGTISKVFVDEGDAVKEGALLATLDDNDLKNARKTSEATYHQALDAFNRLKPVHDNGSLPDVKWVEVTTSLNQAKAMYDLANNNLNKASLRASENGIIGSRNAEPGMSSLQTQPPFTLIDINRILVKIAVPEQEIPLMKPGAQAEVRVRALGDRVFEGKIHNIGVIANIVSRTYEVKIVVENTRLSLRPGMVCDVTLTGPVSDSVLAVPSTAITTDNSGRPLVYLLQRSTMTVAPVSVITGSYEGNRVAILGGLKKGDEVVVAGKEKIYPNCKVAL